MAGSLAACGTLSVRGRFVVYGDIREGIIRNGDVLEMAPSSIPPGSVSVQSVEWVDGTETGSHVALVLSVEREDDRTWLETLTFAGKVLTFRSETASPRPDAQTLERQLISESEFVGFDTFGRRVYLTFCESLRELAGLRPPATPFVLFVGGSAENASPDQLVELATGTLLAGAVYVLCWGPSASQLEDTFDEAAGYALGETQPVVMTTAHVDESLMEALEFASRSAMPDGEYAPNCKTMVVAITGNVNWYNEAQNCLERLLSGGAV